MNIRLRESSARTRLLGLVAATAIAPPVLAGSGTSEIDAEIRAAAGLRARTIAGAADCAICRGQVLNATDFAAGLDVKKKHPAFIAETGHSTLNYPPHRAVDFRHMKLDIAVPNMNVPIANATQTLAITPLGWPLRELTLDARLLNIASVTSPGRRATFTHDGRVLTISFDPPIPAGEASSIITTYTINDPPAGLTWTPESPEWPGRPAQLHTQGQPETNSYWFPCHDFPNERLTTEIVIDIPEGYIANSNGRLVERKKSIASDATSGGVSPREVFHFAQDEKAGGAHVNYLVTLVVGKFDVVDVGTSALPMPVYVPPGRAADVRATYGKTPKMVDVFARRFDEPYPWAKYAQLVVWNFSAGGMENTSATTMFDTAIIAPEAQPDHDLDGLISHELAHQWWGDLITCNSWEHIWLNEGWATYSTALWYESQPAPYGGPDVYQSIMLGMFDGLIANDKPDAPYTPAMVSKAYAHPWEAFRRASNPYPKGASVLHMLRQKLGDGAFFKGVALYIDRFKGKTVETSDFRRVMEEVSGESLEQFFTQWCERPGVPTLDIKTEWLSDSSELKVDITQTQNINGDNPAFAFTLPVWVSTGAKGKSQITKEDADGGRYFAVEVNSKVTSTTIPLDGEPAAVAFDPNLTVLAGMKIEQTVGMWRSQLAASPTHAAKIQAIRALSTKRDTASASVLESIVRNTTAATPLRSEAARALGELDEANMLLNLATQKLTPPPVEVAALNAMAGSAKRTSSTPIMDRLLSVARTAPWLRSRVAAIDAIGSLKSGVNASIAVEAAALESQDDILRLAALGSLAEIKPPEAFDTIARYTKPGTLSRTRARATELLGKFADTDRDRVFQVVSPLVNDREFRTRIAAIKCLAEIADPRGEAILAEQAASARGDAERAQAQLSLEDLRAKLAVPAGASAGN